MHAITFDTLEYTEHLKAAGVPEEQAKGHARALAMVIKQFDTRVDEQVAKHDRQVEGRLDGLATRQEMDFRFKELDAKVETSKAELRREIEVAKNETIKWMIGLALAQLAMMAGILTTLVRVLPGGH
ncbi:MAG: CCDC90 family protein [Magnetococcus sp. YQC-3]